MRFAASEPCSNVKNERTNALVVMSKTKGQMLRYRFGNETKTFWYHSRICLVENRLFRFCPDSALLRQIERIYFDGAGSGTNSDVLVSFLLDVGTFVERLWNVCSFIVSTLVDVFSINMVGTIWLYAIGQ
jgi:hypothetical protein